MNETVTSDIGGINARVLQNELDINTNAVNITKNMDDIKDLEYSISNISYSMDASLNRTMDMFDDFNTSIANNAANIEENAQRIKGKTKNIRTKI